MVIMTTVDAPRAKVQREPRRQLQKHDVADRFKLALVPDHPKRQPCEVVWRRGRMFGIKFVL